MLNACASAPHNPVALQAIDERRLPPPDLTLSIPGLGPCTDHSDRRFRLKRGEPINVLVHGCFASAGRFRTLAQVFAHQGQQAICYSYDDRRSLAAAARDLRLQLDQLIAATDSPHLSLIGHSQGGLIARHSLRDDLPGALSQAPWRQRLITISAPFSGITAADHCASTTARLISLGLVVPICWAISGEKWFEITRASDFMRQPGRLQSNVTHHLLIATNERDSCRLYEDDRCVEDDFVFSLDEQALPSTALDPRVEWQVIHAGHAAIVGNGRNPPHQLIALLQQEGILRQTPVSRLADFQRYLVRLYTAMPADLRRKTP